MEINMISKESLGKFKAIYREEFGKELSDAEALEKGISLLTLMKAIYKPMTVEEFEMLQKRHKEMKQ